MISLEYLNKYFGYKNFRGSQKEVIDVVLKGQDTLGIMPTGSGKSICYQIPALIMEGLTIVISPLISLMKDQVQALKEMGIPAELLNSSLNREEYIEVLGKLRGGHIKILYISPERLETEGFLEQVKGQKIPFIAVDEAHCISQWGHDFRPSYRQINHLIESITPRPVVGAYTATATTRVKEDIIRQLQLNNPYIKITSFDRPNLYPVVERNVDKESYLLQELHKNESAIIYCATRKVVEKVYDFLHHKGFPVSKYHGGMDSEERKNMQNLFIYDKLPIMVATLAFGMGIDKPDVRKVIHYNMPKSMENYYQEVGRGGRDGDPFKGILLFSPQDIMIQKFLLEKNASGDEEYGKLDKMAGYANTNGCLRKYILNYFNESLEENCGYCQNCDSSIIQRDITVESKKIISCIYRSDQRFGAAMIADILKGSKNKRIVDFNLDKISTHGIMNSYKKQYILQIIDELVKENWITKEEGKYPILTLNANSMKLLKESNSIIMKLREEQEKEYSKVVTIKDKQILDLSTKDKELFETLRAWRKVKATEGNVPPYVIASDATLKDLAMKKPTTQEELLNIHGIGEKKREAIGQEVLDLLSKYNTDGEEIEIIKVDDVEKELSHYTSYRLYESGLSLDEIAKIRGLKKTTIVSHLIQAMKEGKKVNIEDFVSPEHIELINNAKIEANTKRLKLIKELLPEEIDYEEIRFVMASYEEEMENSL